MSKKCFKCEKIKNISEFYKHPQMKDGHLNKCISCAIKDASIGNYKCKCKICGKMFFVTKSELTSRNGSRGTGRKTCSRECWYKWHKGKNVHNFKGEKAGYIAKHKWIQKEKGTPFFCEHCKTTDTTIKYHWSSKTHQHLREVSDWQRLCVKCHSKYDKKFRPKFKIKCVQCGKTVETRSKKRKYCSKKCGQRYYKCNLKL